MTLATYLLFDGICQQAMEFYQSCLGGELTITKVSDSEMKSYFPEAMHNKVVNCRLIGTGIDISASDWLMPNRVPVKGNTVCLYLRSASVEELETVFNKLIIDATVIDALQQQPFGTYGALTDKFGNRWMFLANKN